MNPMFNAKEELEYKIKILNKLYKYIKENKNDMSTMDILEDFCDEFDIEYEDLGEIINSDKYLYDYVYQQCKKLKYLRN